MVRTVSPAAPRGNAGPPRRSGRMGRGPLSDAGGQARGTRRHGRLPGNPSTRGARGVAAISTGDPLNRPGPVCVVDCSSDHRRGLGRRSAPCRRTGNTVASSWHSCPCRKPIIPGCNISTARLGVQKGARPAHSRILRILRNLRSARRQRTRRTESPPFRS